MRLRAGDPAATDATVYYDGIPFFHCVQVDTEEGWADCFRLDEMGRVVTNAAGDGLVIERIYGNFTVEMPA